MLKNLEEAIETSCWNKATQDEPVFVLLARDRAAPLAVRAWIYVSMMLGLQDEHKLQDAERCAREMEEWRQERRPNKVVQEALDHLDLLATMHPKIAGDLHNVKATIVQQLKKGATL